MVDPSYLMRCSIWSGGYRRPRVGSRHEGDVEPVIKMEVVGVQQVLPSNTPVVLLREKDGERLLPIFIGLSEATAIGLALSGQEPPRPMTHDLMSALLEAFSVVPEQVVVSELRDRTFFAEIYLRGSAGVEMVSARPSDAIALAVRTGAQIFVAVEVLEEAGYVAPSDGDEPVAEEQVEEFRAFLETVNPDDFAAG